MLKAIQARTEANARPDLNSAHYIACHLPPLRTWHLLARSYQTIHHTGILQSTEND